MGEVDSFELLSFVVEAHTREIASMKNTEPVTCPLSNDDMSLMAPEIYTCCEVCGIYGHFGFECSYKFTNSQNTLFGQVNSFEEGYEYNQYSNTYDQECTDQSNFSYLDNDVQKFSYHDQQKLQQHYQQYEQPQMQYYPPLQQELLVFQTNVDVPNDQTSEVLDILKNLQRSFEESSAAIKELKTQSLTIKSQIAHLVSSPISKRLESLTQPSIQPEEGLNSIILTSDQEYDRFSMCFDDITIENTEECVTEGTIDDVVVEDNVSSVEGAKESNTEMMVISLPQLVRKLPFPDRNIAYLDQQFGIGKFAFNLTSTYKTPLLENICYKVDVMKKIVQYDLSPILVDCSYKKALKVQVQEEGEYGSVSLIYDVISQDVRMISEKVRSQVKPPPEPPPHVNVEGVRYFRGAEFYRCFIKKFSKTAQALNQLLFIDVIFKIIDACLEIFFRIKTTTNTLDFLRASDFVIETVNIPPLPK